MSADMDHQPGQAAWFATTHWSVVLTARDASEREAQAALETLCRSYWYPIYAYLRRTGHGPHDAQDLAQGFFARLIADDDLQGVDRRRGRFRSFLLGTLKHFLSDERKRAGAQKRGGGRTIISIDEHAAEERYRLEPATTETPETHFDRQWCLAVQGRVVDRLRSRYEQAGKGSLFDALLPCLGGARGPATYAAVGAGLGLSEGAMKVAVHRLRKEFGAVLRAEVGSTVARETEVDEEIRHLLRTTGGP